jgi:retron-type reverse transcriptase
MGFSSQYGYRRGVSIATMFGEIRKELCNAGSVIEIDFRKYFDSLDHKKIREVTRKNLNLGSKRIGKYLMMLSKAKVTDGRETWRNKEGVPQGSVLSPMIANMYLKSTGIFESKKVKLIALQMTRYPR